MSLLPLAKAARLAGVSRATIYRMATEGKLSVSQTSRGVRVVEAAELLRVFPNARLETGETAGRQRERQTETPVRRDLEGDVRVMEVELKAARELLDLTRQSLEDARRVMEAQTRLLEDNRGGGRRREPDVLPNSTAFAVGFLLAGGVALLLFLLSR